MDVKLGVKSILEKIKTLSIFGGKGLIGFDIGNSSLKAVYLKKEPGGWKVIDYFYDEFSPVLRRDITSPERREEILRKLKNVFSSKFPKIKKVSTSVSGNQVIVRNVKFPKMAPQDLEKTIQYEAEPYIAFDIRDVYLSTQILKDVIEEDQPKMETILVAAKREFIDDRISIFQEVGVMPVVIDVDAFAVINLYEANHDSFYGENILFLDIGAGTTNLTITENGYPKIVRDLFTGSNEITNAIATSLRIDFEDAEELKKKYGIVSTLELDEMENPEEAEQVSSIITNTIDDILSDVRRSLDYFNTISETGGDVSKVVLSGGGAKLRNLINYIHLQLNIPCEIINPWKNIEMAEDAFLKEHTPEFAVALGLALRREKDTK
ncbi:MAG: hypothetical protein DRI22_03175 [Caldiserica bacterium]|nr:MAG: hypothetical protein DRI22_03175 [Caldisericota bacterium]